MHVAHISEPVKVQAFGVGGESIYVYPNVPLDFDYRDDLVYGSDILSRVSDQLLLQELIEISTTNADIAEYMTLENEAVQNGNLQLSSVLSLFVSCNRTLQSVRLLPLKAICLGSYRIQTGKK